MKHYWKLIVLVLMTIGTLSFYFIYTAVEKFSYPIFAIKTDTGDEEALDHLQVLADYSMDDLQFFHSEITTDGISYPSQSNYYNVIKAFNTSAEIDRLQKEYRGFMRGKTPVHQFFTENDDIVAYANIITDFRNGYRVHQERFEIEIFHKDDKRKEEFDIEVPRYERYDHALVDHVKIVDDELKIITSNQVHDEQGTNEETHIYTFDLVKKELISDDLIDSAITTEKAHVALWERSYIVPLENQAGLNDTLIFDIQSYRDGEQIGSEVFSYNMMTKEEKDITLPEAYRDRFFPQLVSGEIIYFTEASEKDITVIGYNVATEKVDLKHIFKIEGLQDEEFYNVMLKNNSLYFLDSKQTNEKDAQMLIGDLTTGDVRYEGHIELLKRNKGPKEYEMNLHLRVE